MLFLSYKEVISSIFFLIIFFLFFLSGSTNPVKLIVRLLAIRRGVFWVAAVNKSRIWIRRVFLIIFIGGILIMFMILSSLLPNEKRLKNKKTKSLAFIVFIARACNMATPRKERGLTQEIQLIFLSNGRFEILVIVILVYFFCFIYMVTKENSRIRSLLC